MSNWNFYIERYSSGEWRAPIFRDMILDDAQTQGHGLTFLDIGCGAGFDGDVSLQRDLAAAAAKYIGIEPDIRISLGSHFTKKYRCLLQEAPVQPGTVHVAFAVMVLEHIQNPTSFFNKLHTVLCERGVFWAFTMDARHLFVKLSSCMQRFGIKDFYLNKILHARSQNDYNNYPTYYLINSPEQILPYTTKFKQCKFISFSKIGQINYYLPSLLHPIANTYDRICLRMQKPGSILVFRLVK